MREPVKRVACAVYTRKSTEDGLEQAFNSLDAQREACAAYIVSQRHEGWSLVPDMYDDGGFSGGSMERPALKRLLADVAAGKVNVIVIYKVDRLTRSLADFSRIVDVLDAAKASFVSITQAFNTTTSMGRLTLNMLLSFAQFEREVTGERIRDKIAASKRKGLWMGGPVPLGYALHERKLVVVEQEAELVRHIMRRYLALGSVRLLVAELAATGHRTKLQERASGPHRGGIAFRRGTLFHLLSNRIYRGEIVHKGTSHPGEHPPIVDQQLWDEVQAALAQRGAGASGRRALHPSLLVGRIVDRLGRAMTPTHATKNNRRYRYYVTRPDQLDQGPAWRVPARDIETIVREQLAALLLDQARIHDLASAAEADAAAIEQALRAGDLAAATLRSGTAAAQAELIGRLIDATHLHEDHVAVTISEPGLAALLGLTPSGATDPIVLTCHAVKVRRGHEVRLVISGATMRAPRRRDEKLMSLLAEAQAARALVLASPDLSINRIATDANRCRSRLTRLIALSYLSPKIVTAIVEGRQPRTLTARTLLDAQLPVDWSAQAALLGIA